MASLTARRRSLDLRSSSHGLENSFADNHGLGSVMAEKLTIDVELIPTTKFLRYRKPIEWREIFNFQVA